MSQRAVVTRLPVPVRASGLEIVDPPSALVPALAPARMGKIVPKGLTGREKAVGREVALRVAVQRGHEILHRHGAETLDRLHDHTHECLVTGLLAMNDRVRRIPDPDDRAEIAEVTAEQKTMFKRHHFGILEAAGYRVAKEVDRELYVERRGGLLGFLWGE